MAECRADARRARDGRCRRAQPALHVLHGRHRRRRVEDRRLRRYAGRRSATDRSPTGSIGSIDVSESNPERRLRRHRQRGDPQQRDHRPRRLQVDRRRHARGSSWASRTRGRSARSRSIPTNPDIVWLAALGSPFGPNDERGIFKTTDGGKTWKKTLFVNNETGGRVVAIN